MCWPGPPRATATTCCWWVSARSPRSPWRRPGGLPIRASGSPSLTLDGYCRCRRCWCGWLGGTGWSLAAALRDAEVDVPFRDVGIPQRFLAHGLRDEVLAELGLTAQDVARAVTGWAAELIRSIGEAPTVPTPGATP